MKVFLATVLILLAIGRAPVGHGTDAISVEAENAALAAPAIVGADSAASGGKYGPVWRHASRRRWYHRVSLATNLQSKIDAYPAGTTFNLKAGVYRITTALIPRVTISLSAKPEP